MRKCKGGEEGRRKPRLLSIANLNYSKTVTYEVTKGANYKPTFKKVATDLTAAMLSSYVSILLIFFCFCFIVVSFFV